MVEIMSSNGFLKLREHVAAGKANANVFTMDLALFFFAITVSLRGIRTGGSPWPFVLFG